ncbi:MAG: alpha/beta hydrolase [Lachnospiraceae bacterium]|nr:alpha/beta hydrolase [Lachnospiraceae bacterium]
MSYEAFMFRKMAARSDAKRDAGLTIPDEVTYIRDLSYGPDKEFHTLDLCYPKQSSADGTGENGISHKYPLIISFHGGGYVYGSTKIYQFYCADLARRGFAVVNFNYRLAPKFRFPAPLEDLDMVFSWIGRNADDYPIDPERVFLVGDSAGAQLVSQYAAIYTSDEYRELMGFTKPTLKIRAIGLNCGMYDVKKRIAEGGRGIMRDYLGKHPEQYGEKTDVLKFITSDYLPSYLLSANGDFLKAECEPMAKFLMEKNVPCEWKIYGDETTGHVFHVNVRDENGVKANDDELAFFRKYL